MSLLLETIKIEDGKLANLSYHQARFDKSRIDLFAMTKKIALHTVIKAPKSGLYRCRILYDEDIRSIEYIPYKEKNITKLKVVPSDIDYAYKYADRETFTKLLQEYSAYDEIIIEKGGYLTDTTISNIAFYDGERWLTPEHPLLPGTMRAKLLDEGFLHRKEIRKEDLKNYSQIALMNSMIGFKVLNNFTIEQ
jgi:4-amino-4-deoxychorismate lyase